MMKIVPGGGLVEKLYVLWSSGLSRNHQTENFAVLYDLALCILKAIFDKLINKTETVRSYPHGCKGNNKIFFCR